MLYKTQEGCDLPCHGREHNKLAVCLRFVKLDLVLDCLRHRQNYAFCNLIRAFRSGSYPVPFDKKSHSEHQTLFLARACGVASFPGPARSSLAVRNSLRGPPPPPPPPPLRPGLVHHVMSATAYVTTIH